MAVADSVRAEAAGEPRVSGPRPLARDHPLLRLYPGYWRERYGDEFTALLEDLKVAGRPVARS